MRKEPGFGADDDKGDKALAGEWERSVMEKLLFANVVEARRARRWGIFFKLLVFGYLLLVLVVASFDKWSDKWTDGGSGHTALVDIDGLIASGDLGVDADQVVEGLRDAFKDSGTKGVILRINSPGGSPVQSAEINSEMRRLRQKYPDIPLYAVASDVCASGGYYIAVAADEIYANRSSILGSIGVRMDQFGFVDTMDKLGVERRLITAGDRKALLDPFLPLDERDQAHAQRLLDRIHEHFIDAVKEGRGDRLGQDPELFSGLFWTGDEALSLGLIDGFGDMRYVARELVGVEKIVDFTVEEDVWTRLARRMGAGAGTVLGRMLGVDGDAVAR